MRLRNRIRLLNPLILEIWFSRTVLSMKNIVTLKSSPINYDPAPKSLVPRSPCQKFSLRLSAHAPLTDITTKIWLDLQWISLIKTRIPTSSLEHSKISSRHPISCPSNAPREFRWLQPVIKEPPMDLKKEFEGKIILVSWRSTMSIYYILRKLRIWPLLRTPLSFNISRHN